uniref:Uncharacterized protein n=1 Tax=uncultured marine virus TaxID=186617 RepID=A0A0F7L5E5_9VIRU|nr:hypothetical protein [uncultured marine virus]
MTCLINMRAKSQPWQHLAYLRLRNSHYCMVILRNLSRINLLLIHLNRSLNPPIERKAGFL